MDCITHELEKVKSGGDAVLSVVPMDLYCIWRCERRESQSGLSPFVAERNLGSDVGLGWCGQALPWATYLNFTCGKKRERSWRVERDSREAKAGIRQASSSKARWLASNRSQTKIRQV